MSSTQDPAFILERQAKEKTKKIPPSEQKQKNPVNPESVPRSGEVLDDAGKAVSKISDSKNPKDLGITLNPAGDVVSSTGDVPGKTVPLDLGGEKQGEEKQTEEKQGEEEHDSHDEEHSEYTTEPAEKSQKSGGLGLSGKSKHAAPDTEKSVDEATDEVPEGQTEDVQQKDSNINLEDRDVPITGKDETDETKDELKEVPPEEIKDETAKTEDAAKDVQSDEQVDTDKAKDEVPKTEAPEVETESKAPEAEAEDKVPEVEAEDKAPEVDTESKVPEVETDDKAKTEAPEGEVPEGEVPEGEVPEGEVPEGKVPEGEAPKAEIPKGEVPEGEVPEGEPPKTEAPEGEAPKAEGKAPEGEVPKAEEATGEEAAEGEEGTKTPLDFSVLKGTKVDKEGNLVNDKGHLIGRVTEGEIKQLIDMKCDDNGTIWGEFGKPLGKAEPLPEWERGEPKDFSILKGCKVNKDGNLLNDKGDLVGRVAEGEIKQLVGLKADENGNLWTDGKIVGRADPLPEWEREEKKDYSVLKGCKVNKAGNLVNNNGDIIGKVIEGELKHLIGKRADENGDIWNDAGEVIGKGEPVPDSEREDTKAFAPFENFPDATVEPDGRILFEGRQVGVVVEGDPKRLKGSKVDEDGDILDRRGNVVGKAEAWDEPEPKPEAEVDKSALAGKRVNKAGNVVSRDGEIYGRVIEGHIGALVGRMCDKDGNVRSEAGDIIGKAELVPEGEREGLKEGPFAEISGCTVAKNGTVVTPAGDIVGRLTSGDPKILFGRAVDDDGDILDRNGNSIGKAERWEPEEVEKKKDPLAGRRVNREGNVVDEDGNLIGKLTSGDLFVCSGKEVDTDGDVVNQKGQTIGHVTRLEDIPPEPEAEPEAEPEETPEEKEKRELAEKDKKLASSLAYHIGSALDRLRPICKAIDDKINACEAQPKEERDEEELVRQVRPLIEDGGKILTETNGIIRGLDPDGRIQRNAKQKVGTSEASPEEAHLAELLKELTSTITMTIDNARRKIEGMPHAKKELNPLWALLAEPLFQIIAGVGLLLSGVLGLVGKLLHGLGLGGLLDGLLGGLGLDKILGGLGLGFVVESLTGKKKK